MAEYGESSSTGVWLRRGLGQPPGEECGRFVAWSPDGALVAVPAAPDRVRVVHAESGTDVAVFEVPLLDTADRADVGHVSWAPDGSRFAGACGHGGVRIWDLEGLRPPQHLAANREWVFRVAWGNFRFGHLLASCGYDNTVRVWDVGDGRLQHTFEGHTDFVTDLAWMSDGLGLASSSADRTVQTWKTGPSVTSQPVSLTGWDTPDNVSCLAWSGHTGVLAFGTSRGAVGLRSPFPTVDPEQRATTLEGHTDRVWNVAFSMDGKLMGTASDDGTVRLWRTDDWTTVAVVRLPQHDEAEDAAVRSRGEEYEDPIDWKWRTAPVLDFHPAHPRFAVWTNHSGLSVWDYDLDRLLGQPAPVESVRYMTAKVVLVGDSGVGKTGLGWRLAHDEFREHASTHGQQFWVVDDVRTQRADGTDCEAVLWDLAGQHVYRPVHAIFLDNVDLALVLFDPTNRQEPLKGVEFWLQQLSGGRSLPPTVLVGARDDRGTSALPASDLEQFCQSRGISGGYVSTSAMTGSGVGALMELLRGQIQWERMTTTVTTVTFKRIKEYVLALKERPDRSEVLVRPADLREQLQATDAGWRFTDDEMMTAVGHLENHGYVSVLRTSAGAEAILLAPEVLVDLASSIFLQADKHPQALGATSEASLLAGEYRFPELETLAPDERQVLVDAAVARFLEHNLCFRETLGAETLLIFPGLIKQKRPLYDAVETVDDMTYVVRGRVENVYAALVVLLGHTRRFTRVNYWQNQAQFEMGSGEICGLRLLQEREGEIELVLHYSEAVPPYGRNAFQGLLEGFLYERHDVTVTPFPPVACGNGHKQDRTVVIGALRDRLGTMFCSRCGERIALPDLDGPVALGEEDSRLVGTDRAAARLRGAYETRLVRVKSFRADRAVPRCYVSHLPEDAEWVAQLARDLRDAGVLVVEEAGDVQDDDFVLAVVTRAYAREFARLGADAALIRERRRTRPGRSPRVAPLLRTGAAEAILPDELRGLLPGEFQDDVWYSRYVVALFDLVLTLYAIPFDHPAFGGLRSDMQLEALRFRLAVPEPLSTEQSAHVYLSYSWSEESNALADQLDAAFQERGLIMVRDRRDAGYKASIGRFMERIGEGKCVILVISDAYLKSQSCLFELLQVAQHGDFRDRVFPVVLPDARIHRAKDRVAYVRYWEEQIAELDEALKSVSSANLQGFREDMDLYTEIRAQLPRLADILRDMNALTVDLHRESAFTELFEAVLARLAV
ncbi:TIR domain-containing protein [Streptomyces justiciae]|uniref:TIR domain-containing protein n=1 Tax=Streptomyces justiciae TaxID=2780140 RepID=UPI0018830AE9|nr:TIR domain-containing protein [Streptomyces justiciae]MBE8471235.1 TIR domain-containing protein [Streptomyces justiciae]